MFRAVSPGSSDIHDTITMPVSFVTFVTFCKKSSVPPPGGTCAKNFVGFPRRRLSVGWMQTQSDAWLLRDYAERDAEAAFTELVQRHTNLVYSAALRQVESPD